MESTEIITASWLTDGFEQVVRRHGPPSGLEFRSARFLPDQDPVLEINSNFTRLSERSRLRDASAAALQYFSLAPSEAAHSTEILAYLLRLATIFPSEEATRAVLASIDAGTYNSATAGLDQALIPFAVRHTKAVRDRFEDRLRALRGSFFWQPLWALSFLERDIVEDPQAWLSFTRERYADLHQLIEPNYNPLQSLLRSQAVSSFKRSSLIKGLALGDADVDGRILHAVFNDEAADFSITRQYPDITNRFSGARKMSVEVAEYILSIRLGCDVPEDWNGQTLLDFRHEIDSAPHSLHNDEYNRMDQREAWENVILSVSKLHEAAYS